MKFLVMAITLYMYLYRIDLSGKLWVYVYARQIVSHLSCFVFRLYDLYFIRDYCCRSIPFRDAWVLAIPDQSQQSHCSYCIEKTNRNRKRLELKKPFETRHEFNWNWHLHLLSISHYDEKYDGIEDEQTSHD